MSRSRKPRTYTPYQRIMRAHRTGRGVTLSIEEVDMLALDDAISTPAMLDDARDEARNAASRHGRVTGHSAKAETAPDGWACAICHQCDWTFDPASKK